MKKHSGLILCIFTVCLVSALSFLYWSNVKERLIAASGISAVSAPLSSVSITSRTLALTFDVDSDSGDITELLAALDANQTKATFFITGKWLDANPDLVKAIAENGHELGNHTEDHIDMTTLTEKEQVNQIVFLHHKVLDLTGISMTLFRPPFGACDYSVIQTAHRNDYLAITWSLDSHDWKDYSAHDIVTTITNSGNLGSGAILLFHASGSNTVEALKELIPLLRGKDYSFASVSELISLRQD